MKHICIVIVEIVAIVFLLAACLSGPSQADSIAEPESAQTTLPDAEITVSDRVEGITGTWYITDADGWIPAEDGLHIPAIVFDDDYAAVYTGLNSLLAGYTVDMVAQTLKFDTSGPMTLVAGTDHQMHFESALLKALPQVTSFVIDEADGILELFDFEETLLIVLER